jgi:hypothetical protein
MKVVTGAAVAALLLALPSAVLALATETLGNAPMVKQPEWADGVLEVVNLKSRVYSYWVNGNENFFYKGDARAVNEALRKYAAVKEDVRRVVLLPGPGKTQSFSRKPIDFDWQLHVPTGIYKAVVKERRPVLTVYLSAPRPRKAPGGGRVAGWLKDLDADSFDARQKAERELEKLGPDAKPFLREALRARPTLETRRRLERLLSKLPGLDAGDLEVPKGVTLVSVEELLASHFKGLKDADANVCAAAIQRLAGLAAYSDKVVPALAGMLDKGKSEYVRRVAAGCLGQLGAKARPAAAALKGGLADPDGGIRNAYQAAIQQIEQAKEEPEPEGEVRRRRAILDDIAELKKSAAAGRSE